MAPLAYAFEDVPFRDAVVEAKAATAANLDFAPLSAAEDAFDFGVSSVSLEKMDDFLCILVQNLKWVAALPVVKKIYFYLIICLFRSLVSHMQNNKIQIRNNKTQVIRN